MGIIAWIILGLVAGYLGRLITGGKDVQSTVVACLLGLAGALIGGALAVQFFGLGGPGEFFNLAAWIAAIAGAAIALVTFTMVNPHRSVHR